MNEQQQGEDRRKNHDKWHYITRYLAVGSWVLFIIALVISYYAAPEKNYGLLRYHGIEIRKFWLTPLTGHLYLMLWFSALCSYAYIVLEHFRRRRATDNKHFNILLLLIVTVAWTIYIIFQIN